MLYSVVGARLDELWCFVYQCACPSVSLCVVGGSAQLSTLAAVVAAILRLWVQDLGAPKGLRAALQKGEEGGV